MTPIPKFYIYNLIVFVMFLDLNNNWKNFDKNKKE